MGTAATGRCVRKSVHGRPCLPSPQFVMPGVMIARANGSCLGEISSAPGKLLNRDFRAAAPNEKWLTASPGPIAHRPTARPSDSSRPVCANGPMAASGPTAERTAWLPSYLGYYTLGGLGRPWATGLQLPDLSDTTNCNSTHSAALRVGGVDLRSVRTREGHESQHVVLRIFRAPSLGNSSRN